MFEAARVGDDIGHSGALAGMIAGTIVGGLIAAAGGILAGAMFIWKKSLKWRLSVQDSTSSNLMAI